MRRPAIETAPSYSPDGSQVACIGLDDQMEFPQNMKIGLVPIDGSAHRWISAGLDRTFFAFACPQAPLRGCVCANRRVFLPPSRENLRSTPPHYLQIVLANGWPSRRVLCRCSPI